MNLKIDAVSKKYKKVVALKNFSAELTSGVYGLLGPNGAGKTTLIRILIGSLSADSGDIFLNDKKISSIENEYLDKIGYMPQYPKFYSNFRVVEFLNYMALLKGIEKRKINERIQEVLQQVNLQEHDHKYIKELSGGMRQRLGIAQAILNNPSILILDEPTAGLDPKERIRFRNIISELSENRIILYATHIVSDIEMIAKEIIMLKEGKLILKGTLNQLEQTLLNQVWLVNTNLLGVKQLSKEFMIGNVKNTDQTYSVRVIDERQPTIDAIQVDPTLEDVFLKVFP